MQRTENILIDTHCHPQFPQYDTDRDEVIRRALDAGIRMVCVGTDLESSRQAIALAESYEGMYATVGLHPNDGLDEEYDPEPYRGLLEHPKVVAVGEIGLDHYRTSDLAARDFQRKRLHKQLGLAVDAGLPVILHCREAHEDLREIVAMYSQSGRTPLTGVVHSFTGTWGDARHYLDLGFYIGFNGIITFARDYDETVASTPFERTLLETDAPFLTPVPYRGKRNEPLYVTEVAKRIAEVRGATVDEVKKVTTDNALALFSKVHDSGGKVY